MPKTVQPWGCAGSQLTLKCAHLRQLGVCGWGFSVVEVTGSIASGRPMRRFPYTLGAYALRLNIVPICGTAGAKGFFAFAA